MKLRELEQSNIRSAMRARREKKIILHNLMNWTSDLIDHHEDDV